MTRTRLLGEGVGSGLPDKQQPRLTNIAPISLTGRRVVENNNGRLSPIHASCQPPPPPILRS